MCAHPITMLFGGGIANSTHKILRSASAYAAYTYRLRWGGREAEGGGLL